jgi:hypothetical protein
MSKKEFTNSDRRTFLKTSGALGTAGIAALAGCSFFDRGDDGETNEVEGERARNLAEEYAPALYFDSDEKWFPTDPRQFESEQDGTAIVDGFDAFNGYVEAGGGRPSSPVPEPPIFLAAPGLSGYLRCRHAG